MDLMRPTVRGWRGAGRWLSHRPATVISTLLGILIAAVIMLSLTVHENRSDIREIRSEICSGQRPNERLCRDLLTALLETADDDQRDKIRRIVGREQ